MDVICSNEILTSAPSVCVCSVIIESMFVSSEFLMNDSFVFFFKLEIWWRWSHVARKSLNTKLNICDVSEHWNSIQLASMASTFQLTVFETICDSRVNLMRIACQWGDWHLCVLKRLFLRGSSYRPDHGLLRRQFSLLSSIYWDWYWFIIEKNQLSVRSLSIFFGIFLSNAWNEFI